MSSGYGNDNVRYGGFWARLFAYIIDSIIVLVASGVLVPFGFELFPEEFSGIDAVQLGLAALYFWLLPATSLQGTFGKAIMGLKVVGEHGERISVLRALGRFFAGLLSALILGLGYLMIAVHPKKRGLHDVIAGTYVVAR